tara:strand:+ start:2160 stop:3752 length:1593 start_codon:yes stop_codon:yes gene_type:complete
MKKIFENWNKHLLIEGRIDDVAKKYPWMATTPMSKEAGPVSVAFPGMTPLKYLSKSDPSGNNKYLMWMADRYAEALENASNDAFFHPGFLDSHYPPIVAQIVNQFHKLVPYLRNKDLYSYKSVSEVESALKDAMRKKEAIDHKKALKDAAKKGGRVLWTNGDVTVIRPLTREASCLFGKQTKWCISASKGQNAFLSYSAEGTSFYFFFLPHHPAERYRKVALELRHSSETGEEATRFYDAHDQSMPWSSFKHDVWGEYPAEYRQDYSDVVDREGNDEWDNQLIRILAAAKTDSKKDPPAMRFSTKRAEEMVREAGVDHTDDDPVGLFEVKPRPGDRAGRVDAVASIKWEFKMSPYLIQKVKDWETAVKAKEGGPKPYGYYSDHPERSEAYAAKLEEYKEKIKDNIDDLIQIKLDKIKATVEDADTPVPYYRPTKIHFSNYDDIIEVTISAPELKPPNASFDTEEEFKEWLKQLSYLEERFVEYLVKTDVMARGDYEENWFFHYEEEEILDALFHSTMEDVGFADKRENKK